MAIQLRSPEPCQLTKRMKAVVFGSLLLTCLCLVIFSKPLLFGVSNIHEAYISQTTTEILSKKKWHASAHSHSLAAGGTDRPLVLYAYAESDNARANLNFFLARALHARADFVFIFNGETDADELVPVHLENVSVVKRDNTCYDIGAYGEVLAKDNLWKKYKGFITLNASVRGPFLPMWSDDCWTDAFLNRVTDEVKLVGLSYSCIPVPHVQSMLLATDDVGMGILLDPELAFSVPADTPPWGGPELPTGFSQCYDGFSHAVHAEIGMGRLIHSQGYRIDVMMTSVHSSNSEQYCDTQQSVGGTDALNPGAYFGMNVHPYEMVFQKANRGIDDHLLNLFTDWHMAMNESSWEKCARKRGA